jgi:hypothetical protein
MLPADAIGTLNVAYEIDTGGEHGPARDIEIFDPERNLEWLREISPRSFPRRRDHCRGASFQRCKAPNPHLPRRPWQTNRKTIHRCRSGQG